MRCHNVAFRELGQRNAQTDNLSVWLKGRLNNRSIAGKLWQHVPLAKAEHSNRFVYTYPNTRPSHCVEAHMHATRSSWLLNHVRLSAFHSSRSMNTNVCHIIVNWCFPLRRVTISDFFFKSAHHWWCWTFFGLFSAKIWTNFFIYMFITRIGSGSLRKINSIYFLIESICPFCVENTRRHNSPAWRPRTSEMKHKLIELTRLKLNGKLTHTHTHRNVQCDIIAEQMKRKKRALYQHKKVTTRRNAFRLVQFRLTMGLTHTKHYQTSVCVCGTERRGEWASKKTSIFFHLKCCISFVI